VVNVLKFLEYSPSYFGYFKVLGATYAQQKRISVVNRELVELNNDLNSRRDIHLAKDNESVSKRNKAIVRFI